MMNAKQFFRSLSDLFPFERKSSIDWIVPASIGLGLGIAAGVGLGVLIAPSSGETTRARLKEGAGRMKERARLAAQRVSEQRTSGPNEVAGSFPRDVGGVS